MLGLYRDKSADFTVKHFHERLTQRRNDPLGDTVTKLVPHRAGPVRPKAQALGAPQETAAAADARHDAASGRIAARLDRGSAGDGPDPRIKSVDHHGRRRERDPRDGRRGRGGDGLDLCGAARGRCRARPCLTRSTPTAAAIASTEAGGKVSRTQLT